VPSAKAGRIAPEQSTRLPNRRATMSGAFLLASLAKHLPPLPHEPSAFQTGSAPIANADCQERLNHPERAAQLYTGVIKDFCFLVEEWSDESESPDGESQIALECLATAIERKQAIDQGEGLGEDLSQTLQTVRDILARPVPEG